MIPKPQACAGCPAVATSQHWVPDAYVPGSTVLVLQGEVCDYDIQGQQVTGRTGAGKYSIAQADVRPFQGPDGYDLFRCGRPLYGLAGLAGEPVSMGSCIRCCSGLTGKAQQEAATFCQATHFKPPQSIEVVVALGPLAAQVMGMTGKIEQWRGHVL